MRILLSVKCVCGNAFSVNPFKAPKVITCYQCGKRFDISYEIEKILTGIENFERVRADGVISISFKPDKEV